MPRSRPSGFYLYGAIAAIASCCACAVLGSFGVLIFGPMLRPRAEAYAPPILPAVQPGPPAVWSAPAPTAGVVNGGSTTPQAIAAKYCGKSFISATISGTNAEVECTLGDYLVESLIVDDAYERAFSISRDVMTTDRRIDSLSIRMIGRFVDRYGNKSTGPAFSFMVTRKMADKAQWQNLDKYSFARLIASLPDGSYVFVHPAWESNNLKWLAN